MKRFIYRRKGREPECVRDFLARTEPSHNGFEGEIGRLRASGVDEDMFQDLCRHFANGVQYVADKYGSAPRTIQLEDAIYSGEAPPGNPDDPFDLEDSETMIAAVYDPYDQSITLSRTLLFQMLTDSQEVYFADELRLEHSITAEQYIFLTGVEEAYHHKQKFGGSKAQRKGYRTIDRRMSDDDTQWDDPHEHEARRVVLEAAEELGMIKRNSKRAL